MTIANGASVLPLDAMGVDASDEDPSTLAVDVGRAPSTATVWLTTSTPTPSETRSASDKPA